MLMVNADYFRAVKQSAERAAFKRAIAVTVEQEERQRHLEMVSRFLVHALVPYDGRLDVEEYIDEGVVTLARNGDQNGSTGLIDRTFTLLDQVAGGDVLRRFQNNHHVGKVTLVGLEGIAVGVAKNIDAILALGPLDAREFVTRKMRAFWEQPQAATFTSPGLRGTIRIQRTVPFGELWFRP
jgi:hypothetical protein